MEQIRFILSASHGLFNPPALERLQVAPIEEIVVD